MKQYIVYGNGGHSKVIKDTIELTGGKVVATYDLQNSYDPKAYPNALMIIAIGNNEQRKNIASQIVHDFATLIHPKAVLASHVTVGVGSVILANAVLQEGAVVGSHCVIQPNVTIDHDALVGDFTMIYPNSYVGGNAKIADLTTVPPNTSVERNTVFRS